jgi:hypothetical protein
MADIGPPDDTEPGQPEPEPPAPDHVVTVEHMMHRGLAIARFSPEQIGRFSNETNRQHCIDHFGASPRVCCVIYNDLQLTDIEAAKLTGSESNLTWFLKSMYFLRKYPKESQLVSILQLSIRWGRDPLWAIVERIQALKASKIVWPENIADIWVGTIDGVDSSTMEHTHEEFTYDTEAYGHKSHGASYSYELVVSLSESRCIWMSGPHKSGETNDAGRFRDHGLKEKLEACGRKVIGDRGYGGYPELISTYNAFDSPPVMKFKSRALRRHEKWNGLLKVFEILSSKFRSKGARRRTRFASAFEACSVITQYNVEIEWPLYDVLIEQVVDAEAEDVSSDDDVIPDEDEDGEGGGDEDED